MKINLLRIFRSALFQKTEQRSDTTFTAFNIAPHLGEVFTNCITLPRNFFGNVFNIF